MFLLEHKGISRRWSAKDTKVAKAAFEAYLKTTHSDERSQYTSAEELAALQENLGVIGSTFEVDVEYEIDSLEDAIAEARSREEEEEPDDGEWRGARSGVERHFSEDDEVRRMFGSLIE